MTDDWAAVARAIKERKYELGLNQRQLGERANVSKQTIGELENNSVNRRRSARTLRAVSVGLDWHPDHLAAVLAGLTPPPTAEPVPRTDDDVPGHFSVVEHYLRQLLDQVSTINGRLDEIAAKVEPAGQQVRSDHKQPGR